MQVQAIQSTSNKYNPKFKASFVSDSKGYFRELWLQEEKTNKLKLQINSFKTFCEDHKLEVTKLFWDKLYGSVNGFKVFNHRTGQEATVKTAGDGSNLISKFIFDVFDYQHNRLFDEMSSDAIMYQKLTGQKVKKPVINI